MGGGTAVALEENEGGKKGGLIKQSEDDKNGHKLGKSN